MEKEILNGRRIAILATDGFEHSELMEPRTALKNAGAEVHVISLEAGSIKGWKDKDWAGTVKVDLTLADADPDDYDALMLPGGVINPDVLRMNEDAIDFVCSFLEDNKPIAAICHGPQILIETSILGGRRMTSWPSLKTDLMNAGAEWVDEEVVVDQGLITSRKPEDLPAFNEKMIEVFAGIEPEARGSVEDADEVVLYESGHDSGNETRTTFRH
jgi:protease I